MGFEDGILGENYFKNEDETHFVFNMNNYYTRGIRSAESVD